MCLNPISAILLSATDPRPTTRAAGCMAVRTEHVFAVALVSLLLLWLCIFAIRHKRDASRVGVYTGASNPSAVRNDRPQGVVRHDRPRGVLQIVAGSTGDHENSATAPRPAQGRQIVLNHAPYHPYGRPVQPRQPVLNHAPYHPHGSSPPPLHLLAAAAIGAGDCGC